MTSEKRIRRGLPLPNKLGCDSEPSFFLTSFLTTCLTGGVSGLLFNCNNAPFISDNTLVLNTKRALNLLLKKLHPPPENFLNTTFPTESPIPGFSSLITLLNLVVLGLFTDCKTLVNVCSDVDLWAPGD